jgi:hypothetical protein
VWAFADRGSEGTGEPLAVLLRPGNAGLNTAVDHVVVIREALRQLPFPTSGRIGRKVLVRIDGAGCSHQVVNYLQARAMSYPVGSPCPVIPPSCLS